MPPKKQPGHVPVKKKRIFITYSKEQLYSAIRAVEGQVLSKAEACRKYKIPKTTLLDKLAGRTPKEWSVMGHPPYLEKKDDIVQ